jgi:non-ribosomal peptide synthetase-like protein
LAAGPVFVLLVCSGVVLVKALVVGHVREGVYSLRGGAALRKWIADRLMATSLTLTNSLYATLYVNPFLRLLGARIGSWSEVSTVANVDPDMVHIGDASFIADLASLAPATFYRHHVAVARAEIADRTFAGNAALIPGGAKVGANCLIGALSVPPAETGADGTSWLGSPAMFLPRREVNCDFDEAETYQPSRRRVAGRLAIEFFRVTLPAAIIVLMALVAGAASMQLAARVPPLAVVALFPLLIGAVGVAATALVIALKWAIVGRYRPRVEPLWSVFVRRTELVTALYESVAVPGLVAWLQGTPLLGPLLRLFGAHIGARVYFDTAYLTEFDLVHVEDDAAIGNMCSLQTHLFEDRVMKMSTLYVRAGAAVGDRAIVLYDAEIGEGAVLEPLSLAMKGEQLPPGTRWRGVPTCAV